MPREMSLVSTEPLTLRLLTEAAVGVDGQLVPRGLFGGWALQLVDEGDLAVLTVEVSRRIEDPYDVERLSGALPTGGEIWWTEASAPWGPAGEPGVEIIRAVGALLGARVQIEDGT